jgi:hypothetical protein
MKTAVILLNQLFTPSNYIGWTDVFLGILYLLIVLFIARIIYLRKIEKSPIYRYFLPALFFKIFMGIAFCLVYVFYYRGGDTIMYYDSTKALVNLFFERPGKVLSMLIGNNNHENLLYFTAETGKPYNYIYFDNKTFSVCRFSFIFSFFGLNRFLLSNILLNCFGFIGIWQFFKMLYRIYPEHIKSIAIAVLFIPSVVFWGSGIYKDSYALSSSLWIIASIYALFFRKEKLLLHFFLLLFNAYILISVKPYIFVALLPALLIWVSFGNINAIRSKILRRIIWPLSFVAVFFLGSIIFSFVEEELGVYADMDAMLEKAQITQQDLIRAEEYGDNFVNIGAYETTVWGVLKKAPIAIFTALYRPFIWESDSVFILLTVIENLFLLLLSIYILLFFNPLKTLKIMRKDQHLLFFLIYSLFFAFAIGISASNYGALMRYRIPIIPIFLCLLLLLIKKIKDQKQGLVNKD